MNIPDLNVLVYAYNSAAPLHEAASRRWEGLLNSQELVGIPWVVLQGFVRLMTGKHVVRNPFTTEEIFKITDEWFAIPSVRLLEHTTETYLFFKKLSIGSSVSGSMTTDALIAATYSEHQATLITNDSDFARFPGIRISSLSGSK